MEQSELIRIDVLEHDPDGACKMHSFFVDQQDLIGVLVFKPSVSKEIDNQ